MKQLTTTAQPSNQIVHQPSNGSLELARQQSRERQKVDYMQIATVLGEPQLDQAIVKSCYCRRLGTLGRVDMKSDKIDAVVEHISYWRMITGCMKDLDEKGIQIRSEAVYLINEFPDLTFEGENNDLANICEMLVQGRLEIKLDFVQFSPLFMGRCIAAYLKLKQNQITKMTNELLTKNPAEETVPIEEKLASFQETLRIVAKQSKDDKYDGFQRIFNQYVYDFLRKTKRMVFDDQITSAARKYADGKYQDYFSKQHALIKDKAVVRKEKEKILRQFGIHFCLKNYFSNNDVEKLVAEISADDYNKYLESKDQPK